MANKFEKLILDAKKSRLKKVFVTAVFVSVLLFFIIVGIFLKLSFKVTVTPLEARPFSIEILEGSALVFSDRIFLTNSYAAFKVSSIGFKDEILSVKSDATARELTVKMAYDEVLLEIKHKVNLTSPRWEIDGILVSEKNNPSLKLLPGNYILSVDSRYHIAISKKIVVLPKFSNTIELEIAPKKINLKVESIPSLADLYVDGRKIGMTPIETEILAGQRKIEIRKNGFQKRSESLELYRVTDEISKTYVLDEQQRTISMKYSPAGGLLYLDGISTAPLNSIKVARTSTPLIRYEVAGYQGKEIQLTQETKNIEFKLEPSYSTIRINSVPKAKVFISKNFMGETPVNLRLLAKSHLIELKAEGYVPYSLRVELNESTSNSYLAELTSIKDHRLSVSQNQIKNSLDIKMKKFSPTKFSIGSPRSQKGQMANEQIRVVDFNRSFYFSEYEITNQQFSAFSGSSRSDDLPVVGISWQQAALFCNWLSDKEGFEPFYRTYKRKVIGFDRKSLGYRLPSESEWEYVARFANKKKPSIFVWGDEYVVPEDAGNLADVAAKELVEVHLGKYNDNYVKEAPVGSFPREISGVYDMTGNVSEWVHDFYSLEPPNTERVFLNYMGPEYGEGHIIKGSNYTSSSWTELRAAFKQSSQEARSEVGFRIARYIN